MDEWKEFRLWASRMEDIKWCERNCKAPMPLGRPYYIVKDCQLCFHRCKKDKE